MPTIISTDTVWTSGHTIILTDDVQIASGATLTIEAGATVQGDGHSIVSFGTLSVTGTSELAASFDDVDFRFSSNFQTQGRIEIDYADITGGSFLPPTGNGSYGSFELTNSVLSGVGSSYIWYPTTDSLVSGNVFVNSGGLSVGTDSNAKVSVIDNAFIEPRSAINGTATIVVWASYGEPVEISGNSFLGDIPALEVTIDGRAIASGGNYFGTTDPTAVDALILDRNDDLSRPSFIDYGTPATGPNAIVIQALIDAGDVVASILASQGIVLGTSVGDTLAGTSEADIIIGGEGNDTLDGGAGADVLDGGDGIDTASYASSSAGVLVRLWNGTGERGDAQGDRLTSIENLTGSAFNDTFVGADGVANVLSGSGGNDYIAGLSGNDTLEGGAGADTLDGGTGDDTFVFSFGTDGSDRLIDGLGNDTIQVLDSPASGISYRRSGTDLVMERGAGKIVVQDQFGAADSRIETLSTLSGDFSLMTGFIGTAANEIFVGTSGAQTIMAGGGNDIVVAGGGNDVVFAGAGNDTIIGGEGNDRLLGGTGNDRYVFSFATDGRDTISEADGGGTDTLQILDRDLSEMGIRRSRTSVVIEDPDSDNRIVIEHHFSGIATNRIEMVEANDGLRFFKTGLIGTATSDVIVGASGSETIMGGGGDDIIVGGGSKDALYGGAGADVFLFAQVSDSTAAAAGRDTIFDFSKAEGDKLGLAGIDANTLLAGNGAFVFVGFGATSGAGTLSYSFGGNNTLVQADVDGGGADFSILLAGRIDLTADDFIL